MSGERDLFSTTPPAPPVKPPAKVRESAREPVRPKDAVSDQSRLLLVVSAPARAGRPPITGSLVHTIAWDAYEDVGTKLGLDTVVLAALKAFGKLSPGRLAERLLEAPDLPDELRSRRKTLRYHVRRALERLCECGRVRASTDRVAGMPGRPGVWYEVVDG